MRIPAPKTIASASADRAAARFEPIVDPTSVTFPCAAIPPPLAVARPMATVVPEFIATARLWITLDAVSFREPVPESIPPPEANDWPNARL